MYQRLKTVLRDTPALRKLALRGASLLRSVAHAEPGLYTLCYHQVTEDEQDGLAAQLRHLGRYGDFIDADTATDRLAAGWPARERAFLVTFDDGYANTFAVARPVLKALGVPGIVFLISDWIDAPPNYPPGLEGRVAPTERLYMTRAEIAAWCADGLDVGSHTATHSRLSRLPRERVADELVRSRRDLSRLTGREIRHFACPWGVIDSDFLPDRDPALALEAGYRTFFTTRRDHGRGPADFPLLPRHVLEPSWPITDLEALMGRTALGRRARRNGLDTHR